HLSPSLPLAWPPPILVYQRPLMGESRPRTSAATSNDIEPPTPTTPKTPRAPSTPRQPVSLVQPSQKHKKHKPRVLRVFRSVFRSFPIITPACKFPSLPGGIPDPHKSITSGTRVTGTLFGYRKGRVSLSVQETPRCLPSLVVELAMQTNVLQKELGAGMVRIALECEKRAEKDRIKLFEEPLWTMYCNGKKTGYGVKRDATEEDLNVMELLKAVSMGAGVLPGNSETEGLDGELAYMRAYFERVVGSKDSETLYMISPDGNNGPELSVSIFSFRKRLFQALPAIAINFCNMGKLAQVLKKRFCHMVEAFISCKNDKGNESGEEPKIRSSEICLPLFYRR
ncbi:Uncharacterized protein TCM_001237 isoform 2, partial [Theobroma cacao]